MLYDGQGSQFFRDQNVLKEDLNNIEYTKIKTIRDSIQAGMATPGVCGIDSTSPFLLVSNPGADQISVAPGTAIDAYGRIITVPASTAVSGSILTDPNYHPAWPSRVNITVPVVLGQVYYVHLGYAIQEGIPGTDDTGALFNTRRYDSYTIYVDQSISSSNGDIVLASYQGDGSAVTNLSDIRSFYTALAASSAGTNSLENGIADDPPPNYNNFINAISAGSLGMTIANYTSPSIYGRATIAPITSLVSLNGKILTGSPAVNIVDWTDADDNTSGIFIIYLTDDKIVHRTSIAGDLSILADNTVLPLFKVYWDALNNILSFKEDLRKWNIALTRIGGMQVTSGSLILNERRAGQTHMSGAQVCFTDVNHKLDFFLQGQYETGTYGFAFTLSDPLLVSGSFIHIGANPTAADVMELRFGKTNVGFIEGLLRYTYSTDKFYLSAAVDIQQDFTLRSLSDSASANAIITFCGTNPQTLLWKSSPARFEFSGDVYSIGSFRGTNLFVGNPGDVFVTPDVSGSIKANGALYVSNFAQIGQALKVSGSHTGDGLSIVTQANISVDEIHVPGTDLSCGTVFFGSRNGYLKFRSNLGDPSSGFFLFSHDVTATGNLSCANLLASSTVATVTVQADVINPTFVLDVNGDLDVNGEISGSEQQTPSVRPGLPKVGQTYFDPTGNLLWIYNGSAWKSVSLT